jgi:hypothetical protein
MIANGQSKSFPAHPCHHPGFHTLAFFASSLQDIKFGVYHELNKQ